ncbi:DUF389 domain-containing protein [Zeaxanthinibacter enoshimensis]|uniref:Putative hydrophobic protein (TIGR00271 family) n=1 Tax=Zeaxanthinibacter enoshimensis TaxID=392009 RepID=A0A4V3D3B6_9FLAO|nr:DUF389 domain-containing protein [Zeaxanthinibacter enoshimensis]TDQ28954.1 putative hydrophobic protein (TIGR00271 family) [Zeaxanthinibacter enoshimensis]
MSQKLDQDQLTPTSKDEGSAEEVKKDFKGLLGSIKHFLEELLDIRQNTDREATMEAIIADIPFKGHTSWILVCSIFIASVGLNANSTAVVIGAMLISPLMGPILGIGMSIAINDIDTLRRSLKNFAVMVFLSVLTAYFFFVLFPLRDESSELLARTAPDIRDVLIAFFGGLALVIARAKKGTIASVIFGVAIATALMPPLCTVGFGLAIGNISYAGGAMYLFIINTIFIALATFLVLKLLQFPMVRYANSKRRRFIARVASVVAILVMIPAGYTFYKVFEESRYMIQANQLISETIAVYQFKGPGRYMDNLTDINYNDDGESTIELVTMGNEVIPDNVIDTWRVQKNQYSRLKNTDLKIVQGGRDDSEEKFNYVNELYESKKAELLTKDERIRILEAEVASLSELTMGQIPFNQISAEARTNYDNLAGLGFAYTIMTNFEKMDTIPVFEVKWKESTPPSRIEEESKKLNEWLKLRLNDNRIQVKQMSSE